jgi:hypothetical protein
MASRVNPEAPLLIFGGDADPNIAALSAAASRCGIPVRELLVGKSSNPTLLWDFASGSLLADGKALNCRAAFVRYDVFSSLQDGQAASQQRALAWYTAITGWLVSHPEVAIFNRGSLNHTTNKPLVLKLAQDAGLNIPQTVVTNDLDYLQTRASARKGIVKPINGGGYCQLLGDVLTQTESKHGGAAAPAIVQEQLVPPELRVYAVGRRYFGFNVVSSELDYRTTQDCRVLAVENVPVELSAPLGRLLENLQLDFAAADFKTNPQTGELVFLEVNSGPMFVAFDRASDGKLCEAMVESLVEGYRL